jgi:ribosome-binding factor A
MLRVGELVRHALSSFLMRGEVRDPELEGAMITVPEVRMTHDLKLANVYIMPLGGENADGVVEALNRHQKYIRGSISSQLSLRFSPSLRFFVDDTFEEVDRINAILRSDKVAADLLPETDVDETDLNEEE